MGGITAEPRPDYRRKRKVFTLLLLGVIVSLGALLFLFVRASRNQSEPLKRWVQEQNFIFLVPARSGILPGDVFEWPEVRAGTIPTGDAQLFERSSRVLGTLGEGGLVTSTPINVTLTGTIEAGLRIGALNSQIGAEAIAKGAQEFELAMTDVVVLEVPLATLQSAIAGDAQLAQALGNPNRTVIARVLRPGRFEYRFGNSGNTGWLASLGRWLGLKKSNAPNLESGGAFQTAMIVKSDHPMVIGIALAKLEPFRSPSQVAAPEVQSLDFEQSRTFQPDPNAALWPVGSTLRVRFLGGGNAQKNLFQETMGEWLKSANVKVRYVSSGASDIRVSFPSTFENFSYVGRNALRVPADEATMHLGFPVDQPGARGGYLHEIGHALGLAHEHQNPRARDIWDREAVLNFSRSKMNWDDQTTQLNFFAIGSYPGARALDLDSVMTYSLPAELFKTGQPFRPGQDLSESDRAYIAQLYP
ncbi:Astacin (Peptidase family M12A) [Sphingomonas sp. OV641]|uniref:M12 family metallopeptidase n=1 Tax=Sphingomonas sp. OV641 TaxID=1881068 RepID=UPI0008D521A1|nr:M12 family metallopeptidase [Sphingomonas sp. OV641]SEJ83485.1 Astacin (Peptidase family M12A) [Sphingomonas sp. OV641]